MKYVKFTITELIIHMQSTRRKMRSLLQAGLQKCIQQNIEL